MLQVHIAARSLGTALCLLPALLALGCRPGDPWVNVTFDVTGIDEKGLRGPPDGQRAVSYEFCIPNTDAHLAEVTSVDPTAECTLGSPGRIGCGAEEYLCIGSTHQQDLKDVLQQLAELEYVERIDETTFE